MWSTWMGATARLNRGEATVFAWADRHGATAVVDDRSARRVAQQHGLEAHGTLWIIAKGVEHGRATVESASSLVDMLLKHGDRYPFEIGGFRYWARCKGLLPT